VSAPDLTISAGRGLSRRAGVVTAVSGGAWVANISRTHALYAEGDGYRIRLPRMEQHGEPSGGWFVRVGTTLVGSRNMLDEGKALHVVVVGQVPEMEPELASADVAVVPVRYGSGTRLKILESFAHRVPVVSTTIGAEGLDVSDGVHLLLADNADAFAAACERIVTDNDLRAKLVEAAETRFLECYESQVARTQIVQLVGELATSR